MICNCYGQAKPARSVTGTGLHSVGICSAVEGNFSTSVNGDQGLQAVIQAAEADAEFTGQFPLRQARVGLEQAHDLEMVF